MSAPEIIQRYVRRSAWAVGFFAFARGLIRASFFLVPFFAALAGLDHFFDLSSFFRKTMWVLGCAGGLLFFGWGFWPLSLFRVKARSKSLAESNPAFREDDLEIAFNFSQKQTAPGVSDELKGDFLARMSEKLRTAGAASCFPRYPWKKRGALCAVFIFVLPALPWPGRVMFPFVSTRMRDFIEVKPGNAEVPFGSTARVEVSLKVPSADKPELFVKSGGDWVEMSPDHESANAFGFECKNIVAPLSYRVFWRGEWGERFTLTPVKALSVDSFQITITPPSYLGAEAKSQTTPEISGLAGSSVLLSAVLNRPITDATLLLPDGEQVKMTILTDAKIEARFSLQKSGVYGFSFSESRYPLQIRSDEPPTLSLLSPAEDLIVSAKDKLPVTFEAADDMGLGEINLIVEREKGNPQTRTVQTFSSPTPNILSTYDWDLGAANFKPGDVFRFQLEAVDKNTVTGPGRTKSEWRLIEIASFEKSHEALAQILEAWREKALDLLGDVNTTKSKLDAEAPDASKLNESMNKVAQNSSDVERSLDKILSLMEKDPLADYGVWLEHKEMKDNLTTVNETLMRQAQSAVQTGNKKEAAAALEQIASELERMLSLSEELSKKQRASDVMEMGENLKKLGEDMVRKLEQNPAEEAINRMLQEAQSLLSQMAKTIQQFPKELPDDFVNQEALKNLDIGKADDILSQIQQAMKQGDTKKALALAKQYLEAAKKMAEQLSEAYDSYSDENSAEQLADEIEKRAEKLSEITKKQQELLAETQKMESQRLKEMLKEQEKLLETLYKEQMEAIAKAERIMANNAFHSQVRQIMSVEITSMRLVADELRMKKIQRSVPLLEQMVMELQTTDNFLSVASTTVAGVSDMRDVRERENKILEKLKKPDLPESPMTDTEREAFSAMKSNQSALGKETQTLRKELQALSRKSASLDMSISEPLSKAASEMDNAAKQLGEGKSKEAQGSEERALAHLGQAGESLSGAQEMMGSMPGKGRPGGSGGGGGPRAIVRPGGGGGRGLQTGKVRLPSAQDYKPPKEFREELLESLKEKYPKAYEEIIHKYYKRLTD